MVGNVPGSLPRAKNAPQSPGEIREIVGISPWASRIRAHIQTVAAQATTVLVTGPSGTGKELVARAIHAASTRAAGPLIPVNCAALTGSLCTSHLFGHIKGAFTGANYSALGCFRAAAGGTIFLDEIGEIDLETQAKLLRALQERTIVPVGCHEEIAVDVRIIAATNRNLRELVNDGRFREDLFYRINVVTLDAVPLCERPEDILILAEHILLKISIRHGLGLKRLSLSAMQLLLAYSWPGNVRELENVLERAVLFTPGDSIAAETIGTLDHRSGRPQPSAAEVSASDKVRELDDTASDDSEADDVHRDAGGRWLTLQQLEREHIRLTLEMAYYNQSAAARMLEIDRFYLRRKINKYGLKLPAHRQPA